MYFSAESIIAPVHLLVYSTLLGTELYQSFVMVKVAYQALPRSAFTSLQKRVFPIYFRGQSILLLFLGATVPPSGIFSLGRQRKVWLPFLVAGATAALNLLTFGPRTRTLMLERVHQATRNEKSQADAAILSDKTRLLNRSFSRAHAMSIHLNLITIGATLWYGVLLASKLRFDDL
ncbi:hypothetical protein BKA63DRAFT_435067 [Paraphoma chrysanthemicola]|nr:hypothetical protein BKA63DRAFT_435067 [Paraphoma chrysanthemicola]